MYVKVEACVQMPLGLSFGVASALPDRTKLKNLILVNVSNLTVKLGLN